MKLWILPTTISFSFLLWALAAINAMYYILYSGILSLVQTNSLSFGIKRRYLRLSERQQKRNHSPAGSTITRCILIQKGWQVKPHKARHLSLFCTSQKFPERLSGNVLFRAWLTMINIKSKKYPFYSWYYHSNCP